MSAFPRESHGIYPLQSDPFQRCAGRLGPQRPALKPTSGPYRLGAKVSHIASVGHHHSEWSCFTVRSTRHDGLGKLPRPIQLRTRPIHADLPMYPPGLKHVYCNEVGVTRAGKGCSRPRIAPATAP